MKPFEYLAPSSLEEALSALKEGGPHIAGPWRLIWETLRTASGFSADDFDEFVGDCDLDPGTPVPEDHPD